MVHSIYLRGYISFCLETSLIESNAFGKAKFPAAGIVGELALYYRASDFPGHLTGVSWWGPEDRRSGDGELNVVG